MIKDLFNKYGCDKSKKHCYDLFYQPLVDAHVDKEINFLEIGVFKADSTVAFEESLPKASIYGADIFKRVDIQDCRNRFAANSQVYFEKCNSMEKTSVINCMKAFNNVKFDIIIDDGAHYPKANQLTFENFIPYLKKGGIYVIEDVWPIDRMTMKQLEHVWLKQYPDRYNQLEQNRFVTSLNQAKDQYNLEIKEHDFRSKSGEPDSYILEIIKHG